MLISDFKIRFVENSMLSEDLVGKIIKIKQEYWSYTYEEHKKWMEENIKNGEYHLILQGNNDQIVAYLNIIKTNIVQDNFEEEVMGIGNVCVEKSLSGQGIGQLLMHLCNYYLGYYNKKAVLLCKDHLIRFYSNSGWLKYDGEVYLREKRYEGVIMFNEDIKSTKILIERNF